MKAEEIRDRARLLARRPLRRPRPERLEAEVAEFRRRTPQTRRILQRSQRVLPRGGTEHVDPLAHPYPLVMTGGSGATVTDVDGNRYVDCICAGGAVLLGHNHPALNARLGDLVATRTNFHGYLDEYEVLAAEKICEIFPSAESVRFTASGAEANVAAMRIARAFTGRRRIVKFRGGYHGWGDQFMTDLEVPGSEDYLAGGVPPEFLSLTTLVSQNDLEELERVLASGEIAAVLCEPVGAESGLIPFDEDFHEQAIEIAHRHGTLYVFDEVVTGPRVGVGGAQRKLGVRPDLTTLGKGLMNGYPGCGAVCGRKDIMDTAHTALPGDRPSAYIGGTTSGNVLSAAAAFHTLSEISAHGVFAAADAVAEDLVRRLNELFEARGTDFFAYRFGTIIRMEFTGHHSMPLSGDRERDFAAVLERRTILDDYMVPVQNAGVLSRWGRDMVSTAQTTNDNTKVVAAYDRFLDILA